MVGTSKLSRRGLLRGTLALGALGYGRPRASAATGAAVKLPARESFVIRNAFVMTMDGATGDGTTKSF